MFSLHTGGPRPFPIGLETATQIFEPWLLKTVYYDEYNGVREFVREPANRYPDLEKVRELIKDNLPDKLDRQERIVFLADVEAAKSVEDAMSSYLRLLGKKTFQGTFPNG